MLTSQKRPTGITILGVLSVVTGIISIVFGIAIAVAGMALPLFLREEVILANEMVTGIPIEFAGMIAAIMGIGFIGIGVFSLIVGMGLLKGKKWGWTLEVISMFISLGIGVLYLIDDVASGIATLIISALILYYLYRANVKAYFGKITLSLPDSNDDVS